MSKRALDVGNCDADHAAIQSVLHSHFDVEVAQTHGIEDTLDQLSSTRFDLILVNRKLDHDQSDGLTIIQRVKADPVLAEMPIMMLTNYAEHQQAAVAAGAERGFGKAELRSAATIDKLREFLA